MSGRARACGVTGTVLFTLVWLGLGAVAPDYSPARHWISSLALAPGVGRVQVVAFLASGVLVLAFADGLRRAVPDGPGSTWGPRWVGVAGAGLVAAGVFPIEPALGYPPAAVAAAGWTGPLHDVAGLAVFTGLTVAAAVWSRRFRRGWSVACAVGVAGFWLAGGVLAGLDYAEVWTPAPAGLAERISITIGMLWLLVLAVDRRALPAPRPDRATPGQG
jgi:hypothetical membrane protein